MRVRTLITLALLVTLPHVAFAQRWVNYKNDVDRFGINLPNESDIRENYGSKSVNLSNVIETYEMARAGGSAREFAWSEDEAARAVEWAALSRDVHTNLHEVVGHASGQVRPENKNPAQILGRTGYGWRCTRRCWGWRRSTPREWCTTTSSRPTF